MMISFSLRPGDASGKTKLTVPSFCYAFVIAPVTAVLGNNDYGIPGLDCRETEVVELGGLRVLVHHIVDPRAPIPSIGVRFSQAAPQMVIFGHTHKVFDETLGGVRFVNPGYAGKQRFSLERTLALLTLEPSGMRIEFKAL